MKREQRKHYENVAEYAASLIIDGSVRFAKPRPHVENPVQDTALQHRAFLKSLKPTKNPEPQIALSDLMSATERGFRTHVLLEWALRGNRDEPIWVIDPKGGSYAIPGDIFHTPRSLGKSAFAVLQGDERMPHCQNESAAGSLADAALHDVVEWVSEVFPFPESGIFQLKQPSSLPNLNKDASFADGLYFAHPRLSTRYPRPERG